ncbi:putative small nuclear ribonucleoprotein G, partial [Cucurbita argyrosperma subsp. sororia]
MSCRLVNKIGGLAKTCCSIRVFPSSDHCSTKTSSHLSFFTMSRSGQPPDLKKYMDKKLQIKMNANRLVVGTLRGFDQFMNLVVDNTVEVNGNEKTEIGMVVIRGNSVVTVEALEPVNRMQ